MSNNTCDEFNFCMSFKMALQLRTMLLGQLRDVPLSEVEWDIVRSRPQSEESPTKSPNSASLEIVSACIRDALNELLFDEQEITAIVDNVRKRLQA